MEILEGRYALIFLIFFSPKKYLLILRREEKWIGEKSGGEKLLYVFWRGKDSAKSTTFFFEMWRKIKFFCDVFYKYRIFIVDREKCFLCLIWRRIIKLLRINFVLICF